MVERNRGLDAFAASASESKPSGRWISFRALRRVLPPAQWPRQHHARRPVVANALST